MLNLIFLFSLNIIIFPLVFARAQAASMLQCSRRPWLIQQGGPHDKRRRARLQQGEAVPTAGCRRRVQSEPRLCIIMWVSTSPGEYRYVGFFEVAGGGRVLAAPTAGNAAVKGTANSWPA